MDSGIQFVEPILKTPLGPITLKNFITLSCDVQYNAISAIEIAYPLTESVNLGFTDQSIVSIRLGFWNGETRNIEQYVMENTNDEKVADGVRVRTLSGRSSLAFFDDAVVYPSNWPGTAPPGHEFIEQTVGAIFRTLILRAKNRGALTSLNETGFTGVVDSEGAVWSHQHSQTYATGTKYTQVLQEFMDRGYVDAWFDEDLNIHMVNGGSRGEHIDIGTVEIRPAQNVSEMTTSTNSSESVSVVLLEGQEGTAVERTDVSMEATLGRRRERHVQQGGVNDAGILTLLADAELGLYGRVPSEETVGISNSGILPFLDFGVGDWVWVRYQVDADPVERRVRQLAINVSETRDISLGVTLNSILYESDVALARKVEAYTGGGGNYGSTVNTQDDLTVPTSPVSVGITSGYFTDNAGTYQGALVVNWVAPTMNEDGSALNDLDHYEMQFKYTDGGGSDWHQLNRTASTETFIAYSPVTPGRTAVARVRAVDATGHVSVWKESAPTALDTDVTPPPAPSTPVATSQAGYINVAWDGRDLNGFLMPSDLAFVEVWQSPVAVFTPGVGADAVKIGTFNSSGVMQAPGLADNQTVYYKFRAVDKARNLSPLSFVDSAIKYPSGGSVSPPASSPDLSAEGLPTSILLKSEAVDRLGWTKLTYEISEDEGVTWEELPNCPTTSQIYIANSMPSTGALLKPDVVYLFRVIASNGIGSSTPSDSVTGALDPTGIDELVAAKISAGFVMAEAIQVGAITIDPVTGITIPWEGGQIVFPADGVSPVEITAHVIASSLHVPNGANINGESHLSGEIQIDAVIPDPTIAPTVSPYWVSETTPMRYYPGIGVSIFGLARNITNTGWISCTGASRLVVEWVDGASSISRSVTMPAGWVPKGGVTTLGSYYYVLAQNTTTLRWSIFRVNPANFTVSLSIDVSIETVRTTPQHFATIGRTTDTNRLLLSHWSAAEGGGTGYLWHFEYTPGNPVVQAGYRVSMNVNQLGGVYKGVADYANSVIIAVPRYLSTSIIWNLASYTSPRGGLSQLTAEKWPRPFNTPVAGLWWNGTNFKVLLSTGVIATLNTQKTPAGPFRFGYAYSTDDNMYHTGISPDGAAAYSFPPRTGILVQTPPAPDENGIASPSANTTRVYAGPAGGSLSLQGTMLGTQMVTDGITTSGVAPESNNWASAGLSPGQIRALVGGFLIDGKSDGSIGNGTFKDSVIAAVAAAFGLTPL